jgi:Tfp pilus assembly protein PilN
MHQQINLFQPVFRREAKVFSARTLAQILVLALVLSVAGVALLQLQLARYSATRTLLDNQYRSLETQLLTLENRGDGDQLAALDANIDLLERRLADGAAELAEMRGMMGARSEGYAPVLEALARHPLNGLWLTGIKLQDGELELQGIALNPEAVPRYLALLAEDTTLAKWTLATVQVERVAEAPGQVHFTLRSGAAESRTRVR